MNITKFRLTDRRALISSAILLSCIGSPFSIAYAQSGATYITDTGPTLDDRRGYGETISFDINLSGELPIGDAKLTIYGHDVDEEYGELDEVFFNGYSLGYLSGENNKWSTTVFDLPLEYVQQNNNSVIVEPSSGWLVTVDWGQLLIDGGSREHAETTQVNIVDYSIANSTVSIDTTSSVSIKSDGNFRLEVSLIAPDQSATSIDSHDFSASAGEQKRLDVTSNYNLSLASGTYTIKASIFYIDNGVPIQQDIDETSFEHVINEGPQQSNSAPIANDDAATVDEDSSVTIDVLSNDSDAEDGKPTITSASATNGSVNIVNDKLLYQPNSQFSGVDTISYTVSDSENETDTAIVTVTINQINDAPTITGSPSTQINQGQLYSFSPAAADIDGDNLYFSVTGVPQWASFNVQTGQITGTPSNGDIGNSAAIVIRVRDRQSGGLSASLAPFNIEVVNVNDAPTITGNPSTSVNQDQGYSFSPAAADIDGDNLYFSVTGLPLWASFNAQTGQISGTPSNDDIGNSAAIVITVSDRQSGGLSASLVPFNIEVVNVNDAPTITGNPSTSVNQDQGYSFSPAAADIDGDNLYFSVTGLPQWASFNAQTGQISGTPSNDDIGNSAAIVITVSDRQSGGLSGSLVPFNIEVVNVNDAPTITGSPSTSVNQDQGYSFSPTAADVDGDNLYFSVTGLPQWASFNAQTGQISGTPSNDDIGNSAAIVITVRDRQSGGLSASLVPFNIEVVNVNDAPTITGNPTTSVNQDQGYSFSPTAADIDGDNLYFSVTGLPQWASFNAQTGQISGTPSNDDIGNSAAIVITVRDRQSGGLSASLAPFNIEVVNVNDAPTITGSPTTTVNQDQSYSFSPTAADIDGDNLYFSVTGLPQWASFNAQTGQISGTPSNDDIGNSAAIVITVRDRQSGGLSASLAAFNIEVVNVNDAPEAANDIAIVDEDSSVTIAVLSNDTDKDDDQLTLVSASANNGEASITADKLLYKPDADYYGIDTIIYSIEDGRGGQANATVTVTVNSVNDAPDTKPSTAEVMEDDSVTIDVIHNIKDIDGGTITLIHAAAENGTVSIVDGKLVFTPNENFHGVDTITYTVTDGQGAEVSEIVTVTVKPKNDAPEIEGTPIIEVMEGEAYQFAPVASDLDIDDELVFSVEGAPNWLSLDAKTGLLTGIAEFSDVGSHGPINISVTDGIETAALDAFNIQVIAKDSDGDGLPDGNELLCQLDPFDPADANADSDGDGITNGEECLNGGDPFLDDVAPELLLPADVSVDANALFTKVELGSAEAFDYLEGVKVSCCEPQPTSLIDGLPFFEPGITKVIWEATDAAGNTSQAEQTVNVHPLITFAKDQTVTEDNQIQVQVHLNGPSPVYPLEIGYLVSGTATDKDHDLESGVLVIEEGIEASITINIFDDEVDGEGSETIELTFDGDFNMGNKQSHLITIVEGNLAPKVELTVNQNGIQRTQLASDDGLVTIDALVSDLNITDSHQLEWQFSDDSIINLSSDPEVFSFDPAGLTPGVFTIAISVSDDGEPALKTQAEHRLLLKSSLPTLGLGDSDNDGISDREEGYRDIDSDGIPDYLDVIAESNVLPERAANQQGYLVECDPGVSCRLGDYALLGEHGGVQITADDIAVEGDDLIADSYSNVGGIFNFEIHNLPIAGQSVQVVMPQRVQIPANGVYRKFIDGQWIHFTEDANNSLSSALGEPGYCPPPGESSYRAGLNEGDWCVQVNIEDGGPNDADGIVNASIVDPGGVAISHSVAPVNSDKDASNSGGSLNWLYLLLTASVVASRRKAVKNRKALALTGVALASAMQPIAAQATEEAQTVPTAQGWFVSGDLGMVTSSGSEDRINAGLVDFDAHLTDINEQRFGWKLGAGYRFNDYFSLALEFIELGEVDASFAGEVADPLAFYEQIEKLHPVSARGPGLSMLLHYPIMQDIDLQGRLGALRWEDQYNTHEPIDGLVGSDTEKGTDLYYGLGVSWRLAPKWEANLEWQRFNLQDTTNMFSLGIRYYFGDAKSTTSSYTAATTANSTAITDPAVIEPTVVKAAVVKAAPNLLPAIAQQQMMLVKFARDSSVPQDEELVQLDDFISQWTNKRVEFIITGHTSRRGAQAYNQTLSERRANFIAEHLSKTHGLKVKVIRAYGETRLKVTGVDEAANAQNRRVEVSIQAKSAP
ncbi:tandem-95 repeat protein [Shewanella sp. KX20019]|uniref:Ig-like domain-containing protein n=1 Tax=Shewanella sp. KX20019 TaxID=2803864 RepID=UPI0019290E79|nr:Ig-like domain-containing protein [Shewanella sp. KX20019]QQX78606.1 tandem-95 repeat protein [Shewanella sp. KX20019]